MVDKEKNHDTHIGHTLKRLREERGVSLQKVADVIGVSASYIYRLETNQRQNPSVAVIQKLSKLYNVPLSSFLSTDKSNGVDDYQQAYLCVTGALEKVKRIDNQSDDSVNEVIEDLINAKRHLMAIRSLL